MYHVHIIGIGGAGTSGLAEILLARGVKVSGSDATLSNKTEELTKLGATIYEGHEASNITSNIDLVVYSSAIDQKANQELLEAKRRKIRLVRRAEFLSEVIAQQKTIAVAGTHGKTTTSSMIASVLIEAKLDPVVVIGGSVHELGGKNARAGKGNLAVVEADEFDRSFLALSPYIAVITSLEAEHLDIYKDLEELKNAFVQFANQSPLNNERGFAIVCLDEQHVREITPRLEKRIVTYSTRAPEAKYRATNITIEATKTQATIWRGGEVMGKLELGIPGEHNVRNALAAIAVGEVLAIPFDTTRKALKKFVGAERRFQIKGEAGGVLVIDDFAHHPTEIRATLSTVRAAYPKRRIIACFQPHTFTRTRDFAEDFGRVFAETTDELLLLQIYPSRELPIEGVTSELIVRSARWNGFERITMVDSVDQIARIVQSIAKSGDIVLTIGAGTITEAAPQILAALSEPAKTGSSEAGTNGSVHFVEALANKKVREV
jgi:UDP-N-acetylmuramate--alanine ligase